MSAGQTQRMIITLRQYYVTGDMKGFKECIDQTCRRLRELQDEVDKVSNLLILERNGKAALAAEYEEKMQRIILESREGRKK